ncbi:MAG TPA: hypothetical protein VIJ07_14020 [Dermatophilaceae bacterium]
MKSPSHGPMTSRELVAAVTAAGLDDDGDSPSLPDELRAALRSERQVKLRAFLAERGLDPLDWIRARRDVKLDD